MNSSPKRINEALIRHLKVRRGVNGLGLFTDVAIKKGEFVIEYWGEMLTADEANERGGRYLFEISSRRTIDGTNRKNIARYINHSCRPNCETDIKKGRVYVITRRGVKAGEELCYDYGKDYWEDYIKPKGCLCEKCKEKKDKK